PAVFTRDASVVYPARHNDTRGDGSVPGGSPHEELFIDVTAVGTLASTLRTASSDMSAALGILGSVGGGDLGSAELNRAATEVRDRWQFGIARMAEETG